MIMSEDTVRKLYEGASFLHHLGERLTPNDNTTAMTAHAKTMRGIAADIDNHTPNEVAIALDEKGRLVRIAQGDAEYDVYYEGWMDGMNASRNESYYS
jgi:hypothetical protein